MIIIISDPYRSPPPLFDSSSKSHFNCSFGNVKALKFEFKKIQIIAQPVASIMMAALAGGPAAGGRRQASFLGRPSGEGTDRLWT